MAGLSSSSAVPGRACQNHPRHRHLRRHCPHHHRPHPRHVHTRGAQSIRSAGNLCLDECAEMCQEGSAGANEFGTSQSTMSCPSSVSSSEEEDGKGPFVAELPGKVTQGIPQWSKSS